MLCHISDITYYIMFLFISNWDVRPISDIADAQPLDVPEVHRRRWIYGENDMPIPRRSVIQILLKEGLNQFYVFQVLSCILWFADEYYYYAAAIVVMSISSLAWNIYELRRVVFLANISRRLLLDVTKPINAAYLVVILIERKGPVRYGHQNWHRGCLS